MGITRDLAETALSVKFDALPEATVSRAKRLVIDGLACIIGGFLSPTGQICRTAAHQLNGPLQATIIGESGRVNLRGAIIANQAMMRYLDFNDVLAIPIGPGDISAAHPSGCLPTAMAISELVEASGPRFLEAVVAGYQVIGSMLEAVTSSLEVRGFHHGSVHSYAGAAIAGKLMRLDAAQIANAMGIAGSLSVGLNILDADGEEYVMTKNIADGFISELGVFGSFLASGGLTGPERVIEGNKGFAHSLLGSAESYRSKRSVGRWFINDVELKGVPAESTTLGHLTATMTIMRDHKLTPGDIGEIIVRTGKRSTIHTGDPVKKYPRNKETADHSAYFLTAMAVLHGRITPDIYEEANYSDKRVRELIDRIHIVHGAEFDADVPAAEVIIKVNDGRELRHRIGSKDVRGGSGNPMTDEEIRDKFLLCAEGLLNESQVDRIIDACQNLEDMERFVDLLPLLRVSLKR
jgi:2-methylcitrate dehydratase